MGLVVVFHPHPQRLRLPVGLVTEIMVTGNYRAWRHFVALRATEAADVEIRAIAVQVLRLREHCRQGPQEGQARRH
jgi:thymidylate synthase ThyX